MPFDTTADTTQGATRSNGGQPPAKEPAYLSRFCNLRQPVATDVVGLWLRRCGLKCRRPLQFPQPRPMKGAASATFSARCERGVRARASIRVPCPRPYGSRDKPVSRAGRGRTDGAYPRSVYTVIIVPTG